jgi:hypothetical protein
MNRPMASKPDRKSPSGSRLLFRPALALVLGSAIFVLAGKNLASSTPAPATPAKSLIYAGWFGNTTPTPTYIQANLAFLESQPFNGIVVYLRNASMSVNASIGVMTNTPMSYPAIASVLDPIRNIQFTQLVDNFGFVIGNDPPDFFDDWSIPIQNFANLARALKEAGLKGFVFDNEQYFAPWADYPTGVSYPLLSLAQYQTQVRLRGKQVMEAMVAEFPEIVVITLHGPYISEPTAPWQLGFPQWQSGNELHGPFFAGFQEGMGSLSQNVDGGELYDCRTTTDFQQTYNWRKYDLPSDAVNCAYIPASLRPSWPANVSISYGVYDQPFGGQAMNSTVLATTLTNAIQQADRWVWYYVEGPSYLLPPSSGGASQAWVDAVRSALPATPAPPSPVVTVAPVESAKARSSCGLLGMEVVPIFFILGLLRSRKGRFGRMRKSA